MKTKMTRSGLPYKEKPTGLESVKFHDGMVVSAEDLETASQYPVSLLQTVLRSYFGCGVVCGLGLQVITRLKGEPSWVVRVDQGLAVDCHGFPIELTCPVDLDFDPDPCSPDDLPREVFIALRRLTSDEASSAPCGCSSDQTDEDCNRARDRALVKAFTQEQVDNLPGGVCRSPEKPDKKSEISGDDAADSKPPNDGKSEQTAAVTDGCTVLKECSCCSGDSDWVLLGSVELKYGKDDKNDHKKGIVKIDADVRRWVKPVGALCDATGFAQRISNLETAVEQLKKSDPR